MPAKDLYHDIVVEALKADGWTITDDQLYLGYGERDLWADLGAERVPVIAQKRTERIAVEIKGFLNPSPVDDLQSAIGQFIMYRDVLAETEPDRILYLAITQRAWDSIFSEALGRLVLERQRLRLIVFDPKSERIIKWIS
jgi:hypothetical protein